MLFISADFRIKQLSAFLSFIPQPEMIKTWGLFVLLSPDLYIYIPEAQLKIFNIEGLRDQNVEGCFSNMCANIQVNGSMHS